MDNDLKTRIGVALYWGGIIFFLIGLFGCGGADEDVVLIGVLRTEWTPSGYNYQQTVPRGFLPFPACVAGPSRQGPYFSVNGNNGTHTGDGMVFPLWFKSSSSPTSISYRLGLLYTVHPPLARSSRVPPMVYGAVAFVSA